ncbi:pyridoxal phosphate-dependent aminotransferase [Adhaeribacter radiodurans]|uniref:Histidinol-phosphate aminotransferase family protein n=1 Tax=Adhaeribacter radiodurans TaxID=2745197 RepID=A0A7L7LE97_9BACT|nr:histidinol-phosphate transaminase [Adhaeribacter radiodurans]QMU31176.1 histidinol-phosphate aminotransferase family protein [Adhaeribacter radiodurans]
MNRRNWLKSSAFLAGGFTFFSGSINQLVAKPVARTLEKKVTEESIILSAPAEMKARLNANENPFGPSEKAKKAAMDALNTSYQYPMKYTRELAQKIADYEGVKLENILMDAGSGPLLLAAAMYYSKKGGSNIVSGDPTYASLPRDAEDFNTTWNKVPLTADYKLDLDAMEKRVDASTSLMYVCNPNNPTGTVVDSAKLRAFCGRVSQKVPVFIDEAYIDYLPDPQAASMMDCVKKGQNVIIARTFSKLYGFAGLRVGYIIAQPEVVKELSKYAAGGMSISAPSVQAALAAYQDKAFLQDALKKTMASKNFLYDVLKKEGYEYIPSSSNFVMFPLKMDGEKFVAELMKRGVGVRNWKFSNQEWCRISIGRMDEMQAFADAFRQIS